MSSVDFLRKTLYSLREIQDILLTSEPLEELNLDVGRTKFIIQSGWNHGISAIADDTIIDASIVIRGKEYAMTKGALFQAASLCRLTKSYMSKTPASLVEPQLNYWYYEKGIDSAPVKALLFDGTVVAIIFQKRHPYSTLRLLNSLVEGVYDRYGKQEILVDSKFHHSLTGTYIQLILPEQHFMVRKTSVEDDEWFLGVSLYNSLTGYLSTAVYGYLYRSWSASGSLDTRVAVTTWQKKEAEDLDEVYEWARDMVPGLLEPVEDCRHLLQDMAEADIEGDVGHILKDVFDMHKVPVGAQKIILNNVVESDDMTMYGLMQAVTEAASSPKLSPVMRQSVMLAGGSLPYQHESRCEACHRISSKL